MNNKTIAITFILFPSLSTICYGAEHQINPPHAARDNEIEQLKRKLYFTHRCAEGCSLISIYSYCKLMTDGNPSIYAPTFVLSSSGLVLAVQEHQLIKYKLALLGIQ